MHPQSPTSPFYPRSFSTIFPSYPDDFPIISFMIFSFYPNDPPITEEKKDMISHVFSIIPKDITTFFTLP